jgi:hypothetical protein
MKQLAAPGVCNNNQSATLSLQKEMKMENDKLSF